MIRAEPTLALGKARRPSPVWSPEFWRSYWITMRPYLLFVSVASGLVGVTLADGLGPLHLAAATLAFFLSYGPGQALTDVTQIDTDSISSPYRPLVQKLLGKGAVVAVSLVGLLLCTAIFAALNPWTLVVCALMIAGLATYTPLKRRWWGGPVWNAGIVACLPLVGLLCGGGSPASAIANPRLLLAMTSVFFSYAIFVLLGYFKDVEADRATGYQTLPVRFGRRVSVAVSAFFLLGTLAASLALVARAIPASPDAGALAGLALWALGMALLVQAHVLILPTRRDQEAHPAIARVVSGFVALHLGEAAILRPELGVLAASLFLLSVIALRRRPCRAQV